MFVVVSESREPKYQKIADLLRAQILSGELAPGDAVPGENQIIADHNVSQGTARAALAVLRGEGLISVRKGKGAVVRDSKPILRDGTARLSAQHWGSGAAIWDLDLDGRVATPPTVDIRIEENPPRWVAQALGTSTVLIRDRIFEVGGRPVQWAISYLPADLVVGTAIERPDTGPGGTYARLAELGSAPARFRESVRVRMPLPIERAKLKLGTGQPVAAIRREAVTQDGRTIEVNDMILDGDAYILQWSFAS